MTASENGVVVPVLKAGNRIFELVSCVERNPYNRERLREAVLALYPKGRTEKSVFRGMAIPTLRRLGLIVGFEDQIRLSTNGRLLHAGWKTSEAQGTRVLATILYEIDSAGPQFLFRLSAKQNWHISEFLQSVIPIIEAPNERSARERARDWIKILSLCRLVEDREGSINRDQNASNRVLSDSSPDGKAKLFEKLLFSCYNRLVAAGRGMRSLEIESLRSEVSLQMYAETSLVLTELQFDRLLGGFPKATREYLISFGRSMGAEEKLFHLDGKSYQTIAISYIQG